MGLFADTEVVILKESSDSKEYLDKLQQLRTGLQDNTKAADVIDKEIAITEAGIYGEDSVLYELKNSGMNLVVIRDLYIETEDGRGAQIDYFVITPYVNVFIECKNLFGDIQINNKGDFIRCFEYKGKKYKEGIYSPITQNERHLTVYRDCRKADKNLASKIIFEKYFDTFNKSVVVLANPKTILDDKYAKKEIKDQVIRCDQLITYLKNLKSDTKSSLKDMKALGEKVLSMNIEDRKDYLEKYEKLVAETSTIKNDTNSDDLICPRCGNKLILRTAKKGANAGNQFYGCSTYPKCKYIRNINK